MKMARHMFTVKVLWDEEAKVFFSESDIDGLHIEAKTLEEFEKIMMELAPELALANHLLNCDLTKVSLADMIPAISLQKSQLAFV